MEFFDEIISLKYQGILKLSFGAENTLGRVERGHKNWWTVFPRIGKQSIDDIDELSLKHIRPTLSSESIRLGFSESKERIHGSLVEYPELVAHDDYHRKVHSYFGEDIHYAVNRIISIARELFGYKWSKDIWQLRDFDLTTTHIMEINNLMDIKTRTTAKFVDALNTVYRPDQLENCSENIRKALILNAIMVDEESYPQQMALAFVIDMIRNPEEWEKLNILTDENLYHSTQYEGLIRAARYLNENGVFGSNMKSNVIKFDIFAREQPNLKNLNYIFRILGIHNDWRTSDESVIPALEKVKAFDDADLPKYVAERDNTRAFLGFKKRADILEASSSAPIVLHYEGSNMPKQQERERESRRAKTEALQKMRFMQ